MKKVLLIAMLSIFFMGVAQAENYSIPVHTGNPWNGSTFEKSSNKAVWTKAWQGCGWWLKKDCSDYKAVSITLKEKVDMDLIFMVIYDAKDAEGNKLQSAVTIPAGELKAVVVLDENEKKGVEGLGLNNSKPGSVVIESIELIEISK